MDRERKREKLDKEIKRCIFRDKKRDIQQKEGKWFALQMKDHFSSNLIHSRANSTTSTT